MIKILHVVSIMDKGGVETWLTNVIRNIDLNKYHIDIMVQTKNKGMYDDELKEFGVKILPCLNEHNPFGFIINFINVYKKYGPYDIVHSHLHHYNGFIMILSKLVGIKGRISHSHTNISSLSKNNTLIRKIYISISLILIKYFASVGLACSSTAAVDLFGKNWNNSKKFKIFHCGIDLSHYNDKYNLKEIKNNLNINTSDYIIGHIGRFVEAKNHTFIIDVILKVFEIHDQCKLILIGNGPLENKIKEKVNNSNFPKNILFLGTRSDVISLLQIFDLFLFPSLYEGLPISIVEAQAAGIPCLISDAIPIDAEINKNLITKISLKQNSTIWAKIIIEQIKNKKNIDKKQAFSIIQNSKFNLNQNIQDLIEIYESILLC